MKYPMSKLSIVICVYLIPHCYGEESRNICEFCACDFDEVTPFIDCSSLSIKDLHHRWQIPKNKLNLRTLDLDFEYNEIVEIDQPMKKIPVEKLSFRRNNLSSIVDGAFKKLVYLSYLDLRKAHF